ncbi:MAG: multiheme c-type cytochrome [Planctomycetota bacterium]
MPDTTPRSRRAPLLTAVAASFALVLFVAFAGAVPPQEGTDEAWTIELAAPAPHPSLAYERLDDLETLSCWGCHETIAEEWALTQHGHAWVDGHYQEALKTKRRPQSCYGCHIPTPLHQAPADRFGRKPRPREEEAEKRHFGISCRSCHAGPDDAILGPWGAETDAHKSQQGESFTELGSNRLCLACHKTTVGPVIGVGKDFDLELLEERGMSCVACHMHPVERPAATDDNDQPTAVRKGRSHLLQTPRDPAFLASSFALSARADGGRTLLTIKNRAGHRVPGLVDRKLAFRVEALDAAGAAVAEAEHTIDDVAYLPIFGAVDVALDAQAAKVRVTALHHAPGTDAPIPFLDGVELPVE